jgi:hypothetical protein
MILGTRGYSGEAMFSYQDRRRFDIIVCWLEEDDPGLTDRMRRVAVRFHRRRRLLVTAYLAAWATVPLLWLSVGWIAAVPLAVALIAVWTLPGPRRYAGRWRRRRADSV